jgi:hypothetical protein
MSMLAIVTVVGFAALSLWGIVLGLKGCLADAPPFMEGEGSHARFDSRIRHAA